MKILLESFGVALCGLVTSIFVALADVVIARMTGFEFFTFSIWLLVPAGAMLTGFAAASGYYFGSLYFHKKASASLLIQMVLIAGATQLLIYWTDYATMALEDGRMVADLIPFGQYIDYVLTKSHYRIGRGQVDTGEVGSMGYLIAAVQFFGFLLGGLAVYFYLKTKLACAACNMYLRPLAKKVKCFFGADSAGHYYDRLFTLPVDGPDFAALIRSPAIILEPMRGAVHVNTTLLGCPACKAQMIEEKVEVYNGTEWKELNKFHRCVNIPSGIDLTPVFHG